MTMIAAHVRVFEFQTASSSWTQLGGTIRGEGAGDLSGWSLSLSGSGERVAIGAQANSASGTGAGHVRVFEYVPETEMWDQLGSDLDGEAAGDLSGISVSLARDGSRVAIGAPLNDGGGVDAGHTRVFQLPWRPTSVPTGEPSGEPSSHPTQTPTASPSPVPSRIPTVVPTVEPSASPSGSPTSVPTVAPTVVPTVVLSSIPTRVPTCKPTVVPTAVPTADPTVLSSLAPSAFLTWVQLGSDIDGAVPGDKFGSHVSLSKDGTRMGGGVTGERRFV